MDDIEELSVCSPRNQKLIKIVMFKKENIKRLRFVFKSLGIFIFFLKNMKENTAARNTLKNTRDIGD